MKTGHFLGAVLLGLAVGIPVAYRIPVPTAQSETEAQASLSPQERRGGLSLQAAAESRDPLAAIKTARDFTAHRREAAGRTGSPYRAIPSSAAAVDQLPIQEIIALLEAGELRGFDEIGAAFGRWLEADPLAAYTNIQRLPLADDDRRMARSLIFSHWAKKQPEQMLGMLEKLPGSERKDMEARDFMAAWQKEDPSQAMQFLDRLAAIGVRGKDAARIREDLLAAWIEKDREAAERWLEDLPPGDAKSALEEATAVARLSLMKEAEALEWISAHPEQKAAQQRLPEILRNWANRDPATALARLATVPPDHPVWGAEASYLAQSAMLTATMHKSADSLVAAVVGLPEGPVKRKLQLGLVQGSISVDFALSKRLLDELPESREREQAASYFAEILTRKDPVAAGEWLLGLEASPSRDLATDRFTATLAADRPALAAEWADSIEDPARAAQARYLVYSRWHEGDPAAADQWRETWPKAAENGR